MICMYCGDKTRNENHVCDACQAEAERMARQFQKEVHEVCPNCGNEIHAFVLGGIESIDVCPFCGEKNVLLCSECMDEIGDCQPSASCAYCHGHPNTYKEEE